LYKLEIHLITCTFIAVCECELSFLTFIAFFESIYIVMETIRHDPTQVELTLSNKMKSRDYIIMEAEQL